METTRLSVLVLLLLHCGQNPVAAATYPPVTPGTHIVFPADEGSHPEFRIEWWYVTGWLEDEAGLQRGFQVTFFRNRPGLDEDNPSRFAASQLLLAHAAISDPRVGRLLHDERAARAGFGLAEAAIGKTDLVIEDWSMRQEGDHFSIDVVAKDFTLALALARTQAPLLQGIAGFSQKGPSPEAASHYYSLPQLAVTGRVTTPGKESRVTGKAWFDHEWSSTLLDSAAQGWDWMGINLDDGGALMAFRMRDAQGGQHWAGGSRIGGSQAPANGQAKDSGYSQQPIHGLQQATSYSPKEIEWQPLRRWQSPRTGIEYPVEWRVRVGDEWFGVRPLFDDQESDSRRSTGTIYWEGAVELVDATGRRVGRGYLELTGYGNRLRF